MKIKPALFALSAGAALVLGTACTTAEQSSEPTPPVGEWWNDTSVLEREAEAGVAAPTVALGESVKVEGGRNRVTVSDLGPKTSDIWGTYQAALVTIEGLQGQPVPYNALYFEAETPDHFRLTTEIVDEPSLSSGTIGPGQTIRGWIGFEAGKPIIAIHLSDVSMSNTVATWTVQ
ncbi:hypothetical protein ACIG56_26760 [Nocardia fusca]|uniref:hypothetical protein n=1 Tax=Nocardia fusca TaxID=941183 RepID=UPI0037C53CED